MVNDFGNDGELSGERSIVDEDDSADFDESLEGGRSLNLYVEIPVSDWKIKVSFDHPGYPVRLSFISCSDSSRFHLLSPATLASQYPSIFRTEIPSPAPPCVDVDLREPLLMILFPSKSFVVAKVALTVVLDGT